MCEILEQSHWCSLDYISRIKILISNPQVPNIKTCPKDLNYWYAGFQILDWNSNFQSPLVWTNEKLQRIFSSYKDLFTIKFPLIKFIYYCYRSKNGQQLSPSHLLFSLLFPPSLRYNITHSSNFNFYLRTTHFFFFNYFQFYASRKALVITTNLSQL